MKNKILIVDDNYAQITQELLEDEIDADFDLAYNGLEGFKQFQKNLAQNPRSYSLVIMDINMPVMNGIESIKEIRKIDSETPIIVHSSMRISKIIGESIASGGNVFVEKGGNLLQEVKYWLNN